MALAALLLATLLPLAPQPAPPFPRIITDASTMTPVAPGIEYGDYQMITVDGPLSVHVIAVDLHDPTVRIGTALAGDALISSGETISSMARRTGAVAGINGDYFDINQTNQPLNVLIENSRLIRAPMQRWAIAFDAKNEPSFAEFSLGLTATLPSETIDLKTMNDWPPPGEGAVFITPEYGPLRAADDVTEIALQPTDGTPPFATYRVLSIADNTVTQPPGYYLAVGLNGYGHLSLPNPGDAVTIAGTLQPSTDGVVSAIGGGPLLVKDGAWYADPDGPSKGEFATHMPASGVAVTDDGRLLLFEIDGRQPAISIGVLQPQLASLMIAFGAQTGMQFDGGGSSTIVARMPGDDDATVRNSPSDGTQRRVADGLFVYSDAPAGPAARLSADPQEVRALPGARVPLRIAITDAAGHPARCACEIHLQVVPAQAGTIADGDFVAGAREASAVVRVRAGALQLDVPVRVTARVARVQLLPEHPAVRAGQVLALQARAYDAHGFAIALPDALPWSASGGGIDDRGVFRARDGDASVAVRVGDRVVTEQIVVGEHERELDVASNAAFATIPRDGPGSIRKDDPCARCLTLAYDFSGGERAAYANASLALPQRVLALSADVLGDGNGETLRVALNNAINERVLYTFARIDWRGWRHVELPIPDALPQPLTLRSIYVIDRVGPAAPVTASGSIALRNVRIILAGSADAPPK